MRFRKLRIAWSVVCGVVAVLLIVLWVRSYRQVEWVQGPVTAHWYLVLGTTDGQLRINRIHDTQWTPPRMRRWEYQSTPLAYAYPKPSDRPKWWHFKLARYYAVVPTWFLLILCASLGAMPWRVSLRRFSLRTLLIATTLIAATLGLVVWSLR